MHVQYHQYGQDVDELRFMEPHKQGLANTGLIHQYQFLHPLVIADLRFFLIKHTISQVPHLLQLQFTRYNVLKA
jgi:hypothetical protein